MPQRYKSQCCNWPSLQIHGQANFHPHQVAILLQKKKKRSFLLETTMVRTVVSTPLLQKKVQIRFFLKPLPFHMQGYQMLMMLGSHRLGHISESWSQDHICFLLPYKERYSNSNALNGFALDSRLFTDCI